VLCGFDPDQFIRREICLDFLKESEVTMAMMSEMVVAVSERRSAIGVNRTGLALAVVLGSMHLVWAILVAAGVAQAVSDFIFWLHFIKPVYIIEPFEPLRALALVMLSGCIGYFMGAVFALLWNRLHR
jgi:hypothetical protein